jgi:hypothetical protein
MAALGAAIHASGSAKRKAWVAGPSPAMTTMLVHFCERLD